MKEIQKLDIEGSQLFSSRVLKRIVITHSMLAAVSYVAFFFIMRAVGLIQVTELRFVNYALFGYIGYLALTDLRRHFKLNYFQDFGLAFLVGIVSFFFLAVFIYIYLHIDIPFANYLITTTITGGNSSPSEIAIILFFEGSAMSAVVTLSIMQLFKRFWDKE